MVAEKSALTHYIRVSDCVLSFADSRDLSTITIRYFFSFAKSVWFIRRAARVHNNTTAYKNLTVFRWPVGGKENFFFSNLPYSKYYRRTSFLRRIECARMRVYSFASVRFVYVRSRGTTPESSSSLYATRIQFGARVYVLWKYWSRGRAPLPARKTRRRVVRGNTVGERDRRQAAAGKGPTTCRRGGWARKGRNSAPRPTFTYTRRTLRRQTQLRATNWPDPPPSDGIWTAVA